jgi:heavy-metal exporter, HME family
MFNILVSASLKHRLFVLAGALMLVIYGSFLLPRLPVDVLPDLTRPTVTVMAETEGLAPEEVERLVTRPIESLLSGTPGVETVRSTSGIGFAMVVAEFAWATSRWRACASTSASARSRRNCRLASCRRWHRSPRSW